MLGFSSYAVSLLELKSLWMLSNTMAGLIASGFFVGYMALASMWNAMTDRRDARLVYALGGCITAVGSLGFSALADGPASAFLFQFLQGVGVAATYMPGLRILSERLSGRVQSRFVSFYTAFFGIGVGASLLLSGWASEWLGWRWAFGLAGLGPLCSVALVVWATRAEPLKASQTSPVSTGGWLHVVFPVSSWREAMRDRSVALYTLGYAVHCLELFAARSWTVAFLSFAIASQSSLPLWSAATLAALVNLVSVPSSILGNELAMRFGRRVWIILVMASGSLMGVLMSLMVGLPWWMVTMAVGLHSILIMADSASLTAGLVSSVPSHVKGAAFGFYSLLGFGAGAVGPALFGLALDLAGGQQLPSAWALAFLVTGLGCLAYPFIDRRLFGTSPFHRG
ncbi:MAG: hypothetical protein RLY30_1803 [Pseudomonadota bacterium]